MDDDQDYFYDDDNTEEQQPLVEEQLPANTPPAAFDPQELARSVSTAVTTALTQQPAQSPREMTPEEMRKHFAVWDPDDNFVNDITAIADSDAPIEHKRKVLAGIRDGIMQQSFRAAQLLVEQEMQRLRQEIAPVNQFAAERRAQEVQKEFATRYPALEGQMELVESISASLQAQGFKPKSKDEAYQKIAEVAENILKKVNPSFSVKKSAGSNGKPAMASTNMGGTGGGTMRVPRGEKRGSLASIFDD